MMALRWASPLLALYLLISLPATAQPLPDPNYTRQALFSSYQTFKDSLSTLAGLAAGAERDSLLNQFWSTLKQANQVPFVHGDSVGFLYRGSADRVSWNGDFNGWGSNASVASEGNRLASTDLWLLEHTFPSDARLDYKVVLNGNQWILDPNNPLQQWSGFGPNSELRMPGYAFPDETVPRPDGPRGSLTNDIRLASSTLGYDINYRVYTPAGYDTLSGLPVVYVTDGQEYAADLLGNMPTVLDNSIADGVIPPLLAVFVDPRQPGNPGNNRRQSQYADDYASFATFLADELVPTIDGGYKTDPAPEQRAILGTSLGGLFSGYLGAARPDVFRRIGIHSPAFWYDTQRSQDQVFRMYTEAERLPLTIFMSTGTIHDTQTGARRMQQVFEDKGYPLQYIEVNEGHSWGNWRALIDDPLRFFWGTPVSTGLGEAEVPEDAFDLTSYPNPFRQQATIAFSLPRAQRVSLAVYNALGRRVETVLTETRLAAGIHTATVATPSWPSGLYLYRLVGEASTATGQMLLVR